MVMSVRVGRDQLSGVQQWMCEQILGIEPGTEDEKPKPRLTRAAKWTANLAALGSLPCVASGTPGQQLMAIAGSRFVRLRLRLRRAVGIPGWLPSHGMRAQTIPAPGIKGAGATRSTDQISHATAHDRQQPPISRGLRDRPAS